ncbi:MAG TPA: ABC transporter permease [Chloroflexota bacterium]|nr:ABC transporter permease [Chloroflexota bacterium]
MSRRDLSAGPLIAAAALIFCFLAAPVAGLALNLSPRDIAATFSSPATEGAVVTSLVTATVSTVLAGILGIPLAFALARFAFPAKPIVAALVYLPLVLPPVSAGILLLILYGPYGLVGGVLSPHGILLVDTDAGIVLAQVFVSAPYVIVAARSAFESIEREYEEAATSMGAGIWAVFRHISLPMARGGIAAGLILGWMRCLGEFGATVILAYHPYSLPVLNFVNLNSTGLTTALPLALLALLLGLAVLIVLFVLDALDLRIAAGRTPS